MYEDKAIMPPLPVKPNTQFCHCVGLKGYAVASDGSVWSCRNRWHFIPWRALQPYVGTGGYLSVSIRSRPSRIHRLVCETFHGPPPVGQEVRHLNGNRRDNRAANLAWGTRPQQYQDAVIHGTAARGERQGSHKLTEQQVRAIYLARSKGVRLAVLAAAYDVSDTTVSKIGRRRSWKSVLV